LPQFQYRPQVCRFKTWLLRQSSWRIKDQLKRRHKQAPGHNPPGSPSDQIFHTSPADYVADPSQDLDAIFEEAWRKNLLARAMDSIKAQFSARQIQIFDLNVLQEWSAREVARSLGVSVANVYVTKYRVSVALRKELHRLGEP
jgi:RNA polymerase sigma-70 factor (ECF subfamily)